jgi:hypothetical protein
MPIRKYTNSRISLRRFTAPGVGGAASLTSATAFDYMLIAGGGSGGNRSGGSGGAGGYLLSTGYPVTAGRQYTITVGGGGTSVTGDTNGIKGTNTSISYSGTFIANANGGGFGIGFSGPYPPDFGYIGGGCGGGGASHDTGTIANVALRQGSLGTTGQGFAGSYGSNPSGSANPNPGTPNYGGGSGGGIGGAGANVTTSFGANGGIGLFSAFSGQNTAYGGGAGGWAGTGAGWGGGGYAPYGSANSTISPYGAVTGTPYGGGSHPSSVSGVAGTGGGGSGQPAPGGTPSGSGGSGIGIVRTSSSSLDATTTGNPITQQVGSYKIYIFTGTGTILF